jgi:hypothetical protein
MGGGCGGGSLFASSACPDKLLDWSTRYANAEMWANEYVLGIFTEKIRMLARSGVEDNPTFLSSKQPKR